MMCVRACVLMCVCRDERVGLVDTDAASASRSQQQETNGNGEQITQRNCVSFAKVCAYYLCKRCACSNATSKDVYPSAFVRIAVHDFLLIRWDIVLGSNTVWWQNNE